jgi:hypothetical protein
MGSEQEREQARTPPAEHHSGGGVLPTGAWYNEGALTTDFKTSNNKAAATNPITGEMSKDMPIS